MRLHYRPLLPAAFAALMLFSFTASLLSTGCRPASTGQNVKPSKETAERSPLRVLVIDDRPLGDAISRQWTSRTESELDIQHASFDQIESAKRLPADVVVFPSPLLGQLTEHGLIAPLPPEAFRGTEFDERDVLSQVRMAEIRWGRQTVAVPLGSPQLLLAYRADLFESLSLQPPETWKEYQQLVDRLRDPGDLKDFGPPDSESWQPTAEPLAAGCAGRMLLARAATYVTHRDQVAALFHPDTMTPLITEPPFVQALEQLVAANHGDADRLTAAQTMERLLSGNSAMAIGFPDAVAAGSTILKGDSKNLRFVPLPGSRQSFNFAISEWESRRDDELARASLVGIPGRQAAVSSSAKQTQAASNFLVWLSGSEISRRTSPASPDTAPFRKSQLSETARWLGLEGESANSCAAALEQSLSQQRAVMSPRIPGHHDYLAALDEAVEAAVTGTQSPAEALQAASEKWQQITDRLGRDKQQLAYRRSLNVADWP